MRAIKAIVVIAAVCAATGCGDDETGDGASPPVRAEQDGGARMDGGEPRAADRTGTRLTVRDSQFGTMLFDSNRQAIYVFENDQRGKSNCYGECAVAWPPVYAKGEPVAGSGVRKGLLGTTKRRDGRSQVTYAGRPLYFYDHEDPGQVLCHNVDLNGGLWWVVGADGEPLA